MKKKNNRFRDAATRVYRILFHANDSPHRIALGLGLGVFLGILPGTGPIASLVLATLLRVNKAAAVAGSLLTNTWLSVFTFVLSIKIGSVILGLQWQQVQQDWQLLLRDFQRASFLSISVLKIMLPVITGYLVIALIAGICAYVLILLIRARGKHES